MGQLYYDSMLPKDDSAFEKEVELMRSIIINKCSEMSNKEIAFYMSAEYYVEFDVFLSEKMYDEGVVEYFCFGIDNEYKNAMNSYIDLIDFEKILAKGERYER